MESTTVRARRSSPGESRLRISTPSSEELRMFGGLRPKDNLYAAVKVTQYERALGYGYIRLIPEVVFQANPQSSTRERAMALKASITEMKKVLAGKHREAVLFAETMEFATLLCAHFDGTQIDAFPLALEV